MTVATHYDQIGIEGCRGSHKCRPNHPSGKTGGFRHAAKNATKLKDKIVHDASAIGAGAYSAATGNATVAFGRFESFVGRNPTATLAAAVTVGFMLGLMNRK